MWKVILTPGTLVIHFTEHKVNFLHHINNTDQAIKFTVKGTRPEGSISSLDTLVTPEQNRTLSISVYRKATHTDQFLHLGKSPSHSEKVLCN